MWRPVDFDSLEESAIFINDDLHVEDNAADETDTLFSDDSFEQDQHKERPKRQHLDLRERQLIQKMFDNRQLLTKIAETEKDVIKLISELIDVPQATVRKIVTGEVRERKMRKDKDTLKCVDSFDLEVIKRTVYAMYKQKIVPTLVSLNKKLLNETEVRCGLTSLGKCLKELGFRFSTLNKRAKIMNSVRLYTWRMEYLDKITKYRQEGKFICYLDETWFDTHDTVNKGWTDGSSSCEPDLPHNRGKRITLLRAGGESGWIGKPLLSAKNIRKCNLDYHEDMSADLFESWFKDMLIPALPSKSIIVMDNASYHSRQLSKLPNVSSNKEEITNFLVEKDIFFESSYTKKELLQVVKSYSFQKTYYVDELARQQGHEILRLPPYHCLFNPIELIWGQLKNNIRRQNTSPSLSNKVVELVQREIENLPPVNWKNSIDKVVRIENDNKYKGDSDNNAGVIIMLGEDSDIESENDSCADDETV